MANKYLITGGAGFIGSHLCQALVERGDEVVILENFVSGKRANLAGLGNRCVVIEGDVRHLHHYREAIGRVDAVVHLAALISGYDSLTSPYEYHDVNLSGLLRVVEFVHREGVPRVVFASSSTVYGNNAAERLTESVLPAPATVYALTKLSGEHLLHMYGALHGFSHCSLRLFNVYGPRQATDHPYANVTCKFSHAAANRLPIKRYGDGEQSRDFVYVKDVVDAFLAVLPGSRETIYNVGTGAEHKINALISKLEAITGRPLEIEQCPAWSNDIRRIHADVSRFRQEFGFAPSTSLDAGIASTVDFFRA